MAQKNIRFAQLSFWFGHANGICANAKRHPNSELVCVWDEDTERGKAAAERFGVEFIPEMDAVLAREDIDAVGICSPTQLHGDHIVAAAEAGKHCLVEKPFTRTPEQARRAIQAAEANNIQVMPVYNLRFSPAHEKMKEMVDSGELGDIYQVRRRHAHQIYHKYDYDAERIAREEGWVDAEAEGRRSLYHAGSHSVFWMQWMFGMAESVVNLSGARTADLPIEDNNVSVFRYANGMLVTLHTSETEHAAPLATEIYGFESSLIQVRGDNPSTQADFGDAGTLMQYRKEEKIWEAIPDISRQFQPQGSSPPARFLDALSSGAEMPITMYDGQQCVELLAAAELADKEKRQVEISEITSGA